MQVCACIEIVVNLKHISEDSDLLESYGIFFLADYDPKFLSKNTS